jgi:hypothetical protein
LCAAEIYRWAIFVAPQVAGARSLSAFPHDHRDVGGRAMPGAIAE